MNFQHKSVFETHSHSFFSIFTRNSHGGVTFQRICFFAGEHCRFYICDVWSVESPFKVGKNVLKQVYNRTWQPHTSHSVLSITLETLRQAVCHSTLSDVMILRWHSVYMNRWCQYYISTPSPLWKSTEGIILWKQVARLS